MDMRVFLVQMDNEREDILFTPFASHEIIYVTRPILNLRHSFYMSVAILSIKINLLSAKCEFSHTVCRTTEYEVHHSAVLRRFKPGIRVFDATCCKIFCHTVRQGMVLLDRNNLAILYLEIQMLTASVVVPFLHSLIPASVSPVTKLLVTAISRSFGCPNIHDLFCCRTHSSCILQVLLYSQASFFSLKALLFP